MLQNTEKYENYHKKWTYNTEKYQNYHEKWAYNTEKYENIKMNTEEVEPPKNPKSTSFIVKTPLKNIPEPRKVRELQRKMNIEEVEEPKNYENYHAKPVSDPFKSIAEHRKVRELPRKMNIEEVEEPETAKIHRLNEHASTKARK